MGSATRALVLVTVVAGGCKPTVVADPQPGSAPSTAPLVFEYSASDGQFAYSLELRADRRWRREEHSGSATPEGRLSPAAMRAFLALLEAARFRSEPVECEGEAIAHSTYHDPRSGRVARASLGKDADGRWVPCGTRVDTTTERLPGCLELLVDGRDPAEAGCTVEASAATQPSAALPEVPASDGPLCDGVDLDVVGGCFRQAVALVQDEAPPEGRLLERAAETGRLAPVCASLPRDTDGPLRTASGVSLRFERDVSSWDHDDDGSAVQYIDYRISCDCCTESVSFTIEHSVGGGPATRRRGR